MSRWVLWRVREYQIHLTWISKDGPFLSMQLQSVVTRDALAGTLEPAHSDSK